MSFFRIFPKIEFFEPTDKYLNIYLKSIPSFNSIPVNKFSPHNCHFTAHNSSFPLQILVHPHENFFVFPDCIFSLPSAISSEKKSLTRQTTRREGKQEIQINKRAKDIYRLCRVTAGWSFFRAPLWVNTTFLSRKNSQQVDFLTNIFLFIFLSEGNVKKGSKEIKIYRFV